MQWRGWLPDLPALAETMNENMPCEIKKNPGLLYIDVVTHKAQNLDGDWSLKMQLQKRHQKA